MTLTIMGSGTSHGVPVIACDCKVCKSTDARDKRLRASAFITDGEQNAVIDVGPEFRIQALRQNIKSLNAIFLTHGHADHLHGLDDIRTFSSTKQNGVWKKQSSYLNLLLNKHGDGLKVYCNSRTKKIVSSHFDYIFKKTQKGGGKPRVDLWNTKEFSSKKKIKLGKINVLPIKMKHGKIESTGFLFSQKMADEKIHSIAYLTDLNFISKKSLELIKKNCGTLDHLVIDALRVKPHSTHFNFDQALEVAEILSPRHTWFTHLTHNLSHIEVQQYIDSKLNLYKNLTEIVKNGGTVSPSYDTLELKTEIDF